MRAVAIVSVVLLAVALCAGTTEGVSSSIVHERRHALAALALQQLQSGADMATVGAYLAPLASDCRSPCPALNTMANHGALPHNGKGIDIVALQNALVNVIGLSSTFGSIFAKAAIGKFADPATGLISLCDVLTNIHNTNQPSKKSGIEHAASLTREDRPNGDFSHATDATQRSPSKAQVDIVLASSSNGQMIAVNDFVNARQRLWAKSYGNQPALRTDSLDTQTHIIASVEGCLVLGALSGNSNGGKFQISTAYAQSFLLSEQFPVGWQKSANAMGIPQVLECLAEQGFSWAANEFTGAVELARQWFGAMRV